MKPLQSKPQTKVKKTKIEIKMIRVLIVAIVCHLTIASPLSLRLFLTPRNGMEKVEPLENQQRLEEVPVVQDRSSDDFPSPIELLNGPILFTTRARMNMAASPRMMIMPLESFRQQSSQQQQQLEQPNPRNVMISQRRMDADEELLEQMPYSPQRRMDVDMGEENLSNNNNGPALPLVPLQFPFMPNSENPLDMGLGSQPIPILLQVPIATAAQARVDEDQRQIQQIASLPHLPHLHQLQKQQPEPIAIPVQLPFMPEMPSLQSPTANIESLQQRSSIDPALSFHAFPIVPSPPVDDVEMMNDNSDLMDLDNDDIPLERTDDIQMPEEQQASAIPSSSSPLAVKTEQQRIMVFRSAARLRPVIVDSLETVMQFVNAVAPQHPEKQQSQTAPQVNITARSDSGKLSAEELTRNLDKSIEAMTMQVADVLSMLTMQAKRLLPLLLKSNRNVTTGIVENQQPRSGIVEPAESKNQDSEIRSDPVINEIKPTTEHTISAPELGDAAKNLTETITRYVQMNSEEFRRTWKHFLHNYWNYVQKILENLH